MNAVTNGRRSPLVYLLSLAAIGLIVAIFYTPIWWVSLTAPNYPPEAFPDGVRIHFHMNGVFNGCKKVEKAEIREEEALDCVHEMDTINHYVGMYPIAAGGVIERAFSPFLIALLGIMLVGFMIPSPKLRLAVMGLAFAGNAAWMGWVYYGNNGLMAHNEGYLAAMVSAMDQSGGDEGTQQVSSSDAVIERLRASLAKSGVAPATPPQAPAAVVSEKERLLNNLRVTFEKDQQRRLAAERQEWKGSGSQLLAWHYEKSLGRYFNNQAEIVPMARNMAIAGQIFFVGLIGSMLLLLWGARKNDGPLYWFLVLVPMALPLFFLIDYSGWLWWYGHSLNDMGAFTVKPFMPTVFGDGKVAQFATHSYPYIGFGLMLASSALLAVAALLRRKEWR